MRIRYFLIISMILITSLAFTQSFILSPADTYEDNIELNSYSNHQISMINQTGGELTLAWESTDVNMPEAWEITLCDFGGCYTGIPESGTMFPVFDTLSAYLRLTINPYDVSATGTVSFKVFDTKYPDEFEIIMFTIHSGNVTGIEPLDFEPSFSLFPNPASVELNVTNSGFKNATISFVNMQGKVVRQSKLSDKQEVYNISELEKGLYLVLISNSTGILGQRKVMVQ